MKEQSDRCQGISFIYRYQEKEAGIDRGARLLGIVPFSSAVEVLVDFFLDFFFLFLDFVDFGSSASGVDEERVK